MRRRWVMWGVVAVATLAIGGCASAPFTRGHVSVTVRVEKVRAHLAAAAGNAAAGRWVLAAVHAAHPAEDLEPIAAALSAIDPQADAALRAQLAGVRDAVAARGTEVASVIASADQALASAETTIVGELGNTAAFKAAVASELLELASTEYSDGVANAKLQEESEYQDAYAFLTRARTLVPDLDPALVAAIPSLAPPPTLLPAARVEALVDDARDALARVAGTAQGNEINTDLSSLLSHLDTAGAAATSADAPAATEALAAFRGSWTQVESMVKGRSAETYARVENELAVASASLVAPSPDYAAASKAIGNMRAELAPIVASTATYTAFDAALILLREGVEALLVVAALLAFLTRTGNTAKRAWIWAGGAAGVVASIGIAVLITVAFSATESAGTNRELLEGVTGLFAAAMLVYMSWWLHSKSNLADWQRYIREKSGAALARNSLLGLSLIAFLAVFREGAETTLFYVGIAPSIAIGDLALGLGIGAAGLVAIGLAVLAFGLRIPIRPFFLGTSVIVYYLAFKFLGTGVHALQVSGIIPASPRGYLPDLGLVGAFPTVETTLAQGLLLFAGLLWLASRRRFDTVPGDPTRMSAESSARRRLQP